MEEGRRESSEIPVMKAVEDNSDLFKETNGGLPLVRKEGKKEVEENALDGEFVKLEKDALDVKEASRAAKPAAAAEEDDDKPSVVERSSSISNRELLEANEKVKEFEIELEKVAASLKDAETENAGLKDEVLIIKEKLEKSGKRCEELEVGEKKLQTQIVEAEEEYGSEVNALKEALQAAEAKSKSKLQGGSRRRRRQIPMMLCG